MSRSATVHRNGSIFTVYASLVSNIREFKKGYNKLKHLYADASHVCAAYRLPGTNVAQLQDCSDDWEHGAGCVMLQVMSDREEYGKAVYLVRRYGGRRLGVLRYDIIKQLTRCLIL